VHRPATPDPEIRLLTGSAMPVPDPESGLLVTALAELGVHAELVPWDGAFDWSRTPLVALRTPWDYVERPEQFLTRLREIAAVTTLVNDARLVAWNHHKGYLAELERAGVPVVPLALVPRGAGATARDAARTAFGEEIVIKPAISAGARGTIRTRAASAEAGAHLADLVRDGDALVQPYLAEVEAGEVSLMCFGGAFSHAVRKVPAAGDFRVHAEYGGTVEVVSPTDAEQAVAAAVLGAAPAAAIYARIDLVTTADGPLLMEAELIEPELFLPFEAGAAHRFADVLVEHLGRRSANPAPGPSA
jgi:glutathione synthase/RimK-type ligase-like ATP-grasp enzyme